MMTLLTHLTHSITHWSLSETSSSRLFLWALASIQEYWFCSMALALFLLSSSSFASCLSSHASVLFQRLLFRNLHSSESSIESNNSLCDLTTPLIRVESNLIYWVNSSSQCLVNLLLLVNIAMNWKKMLHANSYLHSSYFHIINMGFVTFYGINCNCIILMSSSIQLHCTWLLRTTECTHSHLLLPSTSPYFQIHKSSHLPVCVH
jgi:hypothetical protein